MGCIAIFLNLILPGLGTIFLTNKTGQGFLQIFLTVVNFILGVPLIFATLGLWSIVSVLIYLGIFAWSLSSTFTAISEKTAREIYREEMHQETKKLHTGRDK